MSNNNADEICVSLLKAIDNLNDIILVEESADIFDVKTDAVAAERYKELVSLRRSLDQYNQKNGGLLYIGFIGHFSAGKSSTINSFLNIIDSTGDRLTDIHPTDKAVTLITDTSNSGTLIGMHRRGDLEVGVSLKESKYLKEVVLVDTPGSGDPFIVEEMVRDFLPICDTIIYVLNSVMPLDSSDLPVLKKSHKELPFIPIKFIVTRASEFSKDTDKPFSNKNLDQQRADLFISELISRLSGSIEGLAVREEETLIIDNKNGYNLEKLKNFLSSATNSITTNKLHSHKISYYINNANKLKKYFLQNILDKDNALDDLLETAKKNHEKYQQTINISNSRLTEEWGASRIELLNNKRLEIEWSDSLLKQISISKNLGSDEISIKQIIWLKKNIKEHVSGFTETLSRSLKSSLSRFISQKIHNFSQEIRNLSEDAPLIDCSVLIKKHFENDLELKYEKRVIPISLKNWIADVLYNQEKKVEKDYFILTDVVNEINERMQSNHAILKGDKIVLASIEQLNNMFDSFLASVNV